MLGARFVSQRDSVWSNRSTTRARPTLHPLRMRMDCHLDRLMGDHTDDCLMEQMKVMALCWALMIETLAQAVLDPVSLACSVDS